MINSIKEIVSTDILISNSDNKIVIYENDNNDKNNSLKKVILDECPSNIIVLKLDKYSPLSKIFNKDNNKGINKGVDAVIITDDRILFIELKSTKIKEKPISEKMFASIAFIKNIDYLLEYFYDKSINNLNVGAIVLGLKRSNNRIPKNKPRQEMSFNNKAYLSINNKKIQILEVKKDNPNNYKIKYERLIDNVRPSTKIFKNWP